MFSSDSALKEIKDDTLGRVAFAERMARDIASWKSTESLVIGLYARWGDGKTTVINFIKDFFAHPDNFNDNGERIEKENLPTIIEFNAWEFSNQGGLIQNFLMEVGKELGQSNSEDDKKIAKKLSLVRLYLQSANKISSVVKGGMSSVLRIIGVIPIFFALGNLPFYSILGYKPFIIAGVIFIIFWVLSCSEKVILFLEDFYNQRAEITNKTLNQLKEGIKLDLASRNNKKILFIIDDVDRLNAEEVKSLFQLIKVNLDLPNLVFLIALDVEIVGKLLSENGVEGSQFIEKIVQVPIYLPRADEKQLSKFLFTQLDKVVAFTAEEDWEPNRWSKLYESGLNSIYLKPGNLRVIKRSISQMMTKASLIASDVNMVDFIGIRTIEHFYPNLYNYIATNRDVFLSIGSNLFTGYNIKNSPVKDSLEAQFVIVPSYVKDIVVELFPEVENILNGQTQGFGGSYEKWRKTKRVCSPDFFEFYFYIKVPEGEIGDNEVNNTISILKDGSKLDSLLLDYIKNHKIKKLLIKLTDSVKDFPKDENNALNIITLLLERMEEVSSMPKERLFESGGDLDIVRLIFFYLKEIENEKDIVQIIKDAIKKSKSVYGPIRLIFFFDKRKNDDSSEEKLVSEEAFADLIKECLIKIDAAADNDTLINETNLQTILYRWKDWGEQSKVDNYIKKIGENTSQMALFVSKFVVNVYSSSSEEPFKVTPKMAYAGLKDFFDLEFVRGTLENLDKTNLSESVLKGVEIFLKDYEHRNNARY